MENKMKEAISFDTNKNEDHVQAIIEALEKGEQVKLEKSEQRYLILMYVKDDEDDTRKEFEIKTGRKETYEFLKSMIDIIDVHESKILLDDLGLADASSVYDVMTKFCQIFDDDEFNIEDYK